MRTGFCLCCRLNPVREDATAGLCFLCRHDVEACELIPKPTRDGRICLIYSATSTVVLTGDPEAIYPPIPWDPEDALPEDATTSDIAELRAELLTLGIRKPYLTLRAEAIYVIEAIRRSGCRVWLDVQLGYADLDTPRRVPYLVLLRFVELREHIEDALTLEAARDIAERTDNSEERAEDASEKVIAELCEVGSDGVCGVQDGKDHPAA